uniref:Uncharacterized protein n=1 Tax=Rhizophora mucronata TaxID=61149 RepID=A0A2P2PT30_RHIMU
MWCDRRCSGNWEHQNDSAALGITTSGVFLIVLLHKSSNGGSQVQLLEV